MMILSMKSERRLSHGCRIRSYLGLLWCKVLARVDFDHSIYMAFMILMVGRGICSDFRSRLVSLQDAVVACAVKPLNSHSIGSGDGRGVMM